MAAPRPAREHRPRRGDICRDDGVLARRDFRAAAAPVDNDPVDLATQVVAFSVTTRTRGIIVLSTYSRLPCVSFEQRTYTDDVLPC